MHIHVVGICGTFMGGLAALASAMGHRVSGTDAGVYPPMSTQLEALGIELHEGWDPAALDDTPDLVVIGNALSRGNAVIEHVLAGDLPYTSGPQWLSENVLAGRHVIAAAGTHGKTTVAAMLAWILECAGQRAGYLVGGVPLDFEHSARLGDAPFFVVEADEYDTAFFDKRSKLVHYRPRTAVLNNLEFDHADIFENLEAITRQFHHFVRTIPGNGLIVANGADANLERMLELGCWTPLERFGGTQGEWQARLEAEDGSRFSVSFRERAQGTVHWAQFGLHNVDNALASIAAARHAGIPPARSIAALNRFSGVRRRMELRGEANGIRVYDDFAHHPTAIRHTLEGVRRRIAPQERVIAVLDPRSNTMRMGVHADTLAGSLDAADVVVLHAPDTLDWDANAAMQPLGARATVLPDPSGIVTWLTPRLQAGDHVVVMSNGGFGGIHELLLGAVRNGAG